MLAVFIRLFLRYAAGALAAHGLLDRDTAHTLAFDPDINMALELGAAAFLGLLSEFWYFLAHRFGWAR